MAIRAIHILGSPVLREVASEVEVFDAELRQFIEDLYETMEAASGVGIAANQVGETRRVAVIDADGHSFAMINPIIVEKSKARSSSEEGCLSIPDLAGEVNRPAEVILEALDQDGKPFRIEASGLLARAIQHEIDHLDGILFIDHFSPLKRQLALRKWKKANADGDLTWMPEAGVPETDR